MTADKATGDTEATKSEGTKTEAALTQSKGTEKISVSVATIENEAEKILDEARIQ